MYALTDSIPDIGNVRESFFYNQVLNAGYDVQTIQPGTTQSGDFKVQDAVFEVGGKNRKRQPIRGVTNSYVVADGIEIGVGRKIPLWLWGMLY